MYEGIVVVLSVALFLIILIIGIFEYNKRNEKKKVETKVKLSMTKEEARNYLKGMKRTTGTIDDGFMTKESLDKLILEEKQRLNSFNSQGVRTGRFTSNPNVKNREETNRRIQGDRNRDREYSANDFFILPSTGTFNDNYSSSSHNNTCSRSHTADTGSSNHYHSNDSGSSGGGSDSFFTCD